MKIGYQYLPMAFLFIIGIYAIIQIILTGWFLSLLVHLKKIPRLQFSASLGIFFLPGFFFYGKNLHLVVEEAPSLDSANLKLGTVFFWLDPFSLLLGKIRIRNLLLSDFHIFYLNKIPSQKKIHLVPPPHKIKITGNLVNGSFDLEDKSRFPIYRLSLRDIQMQEFQLDPGFQLGLFFFAKKGHCKIGSGTLHTHLLSKNHGILRVSGVTIGEFTNLEVLPLLSNNVELATEFKHKEGITEYRGVLGQNFLPEEADKNPDLPKKRKVGFKFTIDWNEYRLPLDLGVGLLLSQLAKGTSIGGVVNETLGVLKSFLGELLKPIPKDPQTFPVEETKIVEAEIKPIIIENSKNEINQ